LTEKDKGKKAVLDGWVHARRDHGGVIFIDLRDRYGITQVVMGEKIKDAHKLRNEYVVEISGTVKERKKGTENKKIKTGKIEVRCEELKILAESETLPIEIDDRITANDEVRLKYRYLDLRRPSMQKNLLFRHKFNMAVRNYLTAQGFIEIETPILVKPTPEGARDYIVPSRINPGMFYALPQSPQLYKQILMIAGFDRYFQIARCLRDEDLRADRQPEHTQIDMEISFVKPEDIFEIIEGMLKHVFKELLNTNIKTPFPRIPYNESMDKYGTDKPDLRFALELIDITEILKKSDFEVFKKAEMIKCLHLKNFPLTRKELDDLIDLVKPYGAKGLVSIKIKDGKIESMISKYLKKDMEEKIIKKLGAKENDVLLIVADKPKIVNASLAALRNHFGRKSAGNDFKFCWVVDYPLFEWNEEENKWDPAHHPFCMPKEEHLALLEKNPEKVHCYQYDLVLNGTELCSGSIRINRPEIQKKVFKVIGMSDEVAQRKFGFLLDAYRYGGPPHGGVGIGIDRLVALMLGIKDADIREVIAFPKNKAAQCPMDGSPSEADDKQMKELHIRLDAVKEKKK